MLPSLFCNQIYRAGFLRAILLATAMKIVDFRGCVNLDGRDARPHDLNLFCAASSCFARSREYVPSPNPAHGVRGNLLQRILVWRTDLVGLSAVNCRPILPAWNVSSTYPPFEQELVELILTPASRPLPPRFDHGASPIGGFPSFNNS